MAYVLTAIQLFLILYDIPLFKHIYLHLVHIIKQFLYAVHG